MKIYILKLNSSNWPAVENAIIRSSFTPFPINIKEIDSINEKDILIIPGVGNLNSLSKEIEEGIGVHILKDIIITKSIKIIGICLGFQFLCKNSEEAPEAECLKLFSYPVESIFIPTRPSVGWNYISNYSSIKKDNCIQPCLDNNAFYFTHSYGVKIPNEFNNRNNEYIYTYEPLTNTKIAGAILKKDIIGYQFHPEKSGERGLELLNYSVNYLIKGF